MNRRGDAQVAGALLVVSLLVGCEVESPTREALAFDQASFHCEVEPVLMARCAFYACHGSEARPFRVYAPNRLRLDPSVPSLAAPLSAQESDANRASALAMVQDASEPLLLQKPLDVDAGGLFHKGKSLYQGRDSFSTADDVGYRAIEAWIAGAIRPSSCEASVEVGP